VGLFEAEATADDPIPGGMVWNMVYDPDAPPGHLPIIDEDQLWSNFHHFLGRLLPVAEEAGVHLAAHPDDPPMPTMRGQARLVWQPRYYDRLFADLPSPANRAELCIGSVQEMTEGDIYDCVDRWSRAGRVVMSTFAMCRAKYRTTGRSSSTRAMSISRMSWQSSAATGSTEC
jgi:mannonate dehydratase